MKGTLARAFMISSVIDRTIFNSILQEIFILAKSFRRLLGPTHLPVEWVLGLFLGDKPAGA